MKENSDDNLELFFCHNPVNVSCCYVKNYRFQSQLEPPLLCHYGWSHGDRSILLSWVTSHAKINKEMKYTAQLPRHLVLKKESSFKHWNFRLLHIFTMVTDVFIYVIITICCYVSVPTITKPCSWQCWSSNSFSQIWFVIIQKYRLKRKQTPNYNYHHCCCRLWLQACGAWCWTLWKSTANHPKELSKLMRLGTIRRFSSMSQLKFWAILWDFGPTEMAL